MASTCKSDAGDAAASAPGGAGSLAESVAARSDEGEGRGEEEAAADGATAVAGAASARSADGKSKSSKASAARYAGAAERARDAMEQHPFHGCVGFVSGVFAAVGIRW